VTTLRYWSLRRDTGTPIRDTLSIIDFSEPGSATAPLQYLFPCAYNWLAIDNEALETNSRAAAGLAMPGAARVGLPLPR